VEAFGRRAGYRRSYARVWFWAQIARILIEQGFGLIGLYEATARYCGTVVCNATPPLRATGGNHRLLNECS
jgi:hypothetical protein